jgi:aspartyl-tRNA(Asn)/glutamyl-tRNA(Gln) amidotransferase subunit A
VISLNANANANASANVQWDAEHRMSTQLPATSPVKTWQSSSATHDSQGRTTMSATRDDPLWQLDAVTLAHMIRARDVSPVEVMQAVAERTESVNAWLNAFITLELEQALDAARAAERAQMRGAELGPLHGIPFSVKDLLNTAGMRTTFGSFAHEHNIPSVDCVAVRRLREAGAILVGKTTTPEFGHKPMTEAPLFGRTANPWDVTRTCGGSSGGAAASVAAGCTPLAVGTDGGGSTRIPAAACGVVGVKQTLGVVPHDQTPDSFGLLAYVGPITRTVADAGLMLDVMAGPHRSDPHSHGRALTGMGAAAVTGIQLAGLRVGYLPFLGNTVIDPQTRALVDSAVKAFEGAGAHVELLTEAFPSTLSVWGPLTFSIWAQRFAGFEAELGERMSETLRIWMAQGRATTGLQVQAAMEARTMLYRHVEAWLERFDVLLTPTLACPAPPIDCDPMASLTIDGQEAGGLRDGWYPYTHPFNLTGHPALTVPCGLTPGGLPVGLQLVGPYLSDAMLLGAARAYEQAAPWAEQYRALDGLGLPS